MYNDGGTGNLVKVEPKVIMILDVEDIEAMMNSMANFRYSHKLKDYENIVIEILDNGRTRIKGLVLVEDYITEEI